MTPPLQASANIAIEQQGNILLVGGSTAFPSEISYEELRSVLLGGVASGHYGFGEDFEGAAISTKIATNLSTGATFAINSQLGGVARLSLDTDDDDFGTVAVALNYSPVNGTLIFSARVKCVSAITLRDVEIGISDALSETGGLAFSSVSTPTAVATDAAVLAINSDESVAVWTALSVKNGGTPQKTTTTVAPVADTWQEFKLVVDQQGNVGFYINGTLVATHLLAITSSAAVRLTPWISMKSLSGAIKTLDIDFLSIIAVR